ncbi:MAG TPA: protein kinase [Candidatus Hydrogenedentes bacterium]|nr:protein kinase [Candidatus Hydrogenedentota bacterium]HPG70189.1 protein kinase [Candidatus Hydrogenedentota bacterium]
MSHDDGKNANGPVDSFEPLSDRSQESSLSGSDVGIWRANSGSSSGDVAWDKTHMDLGKMVANGQLGEYRIIEVLGRGGFGTVYKGRDENLGRDVAIKVITNPLEERDIKLFRREAKVIASLSKHPSVVQIYAWGEVQGHPYFVLEFVAGSASGLLDEHPSGVPATTALRIGAECAEALAYAHERGVLHRDVKPANILIEAENQRAKLADFGLARLCAGAGPDVSISLTTTGTVSGSPPFMSPEQAEGRDLDARSDVFSLGVTLYRLLSGRLPFEGQSALEIMDRIRMGKHVPLAERNPNLPTGVVAIVEKSFAHDPADRYQTAAQFASELRGALEAIEKGEEVQGPAISKRRAKTKWMLFGAAAAAALLSVTIPFLFRESIHQAPPNVAFADAKDEMEQGHYREAETLYRQALERTPADEQGLYGLGFALLNQQRAEEARQAFASIDPDSPRRKEGEAAVLAEAKPDEARPALEAAADLAYCKALLAKMDMIETKYEDVVKRLDALEPKQFYFNWQYAEALKTLGQAYYKLQDYDKASAVFGSLENVAGAADAQVVRMYLDNTRRQLDSEHKEQVHQRAERLRELLDQGYQAPTPTDLWTSRPLTYFILPADVAPRAAFTIESGVADVLPDLLAESLKITPMELVDRDIINDVLAEQELAKLVGKDGGVALRQVLGARLILRPQVRKVLDAETLTVDVVDVEKTKKFTAKANGYGQGADIEAVMQGLADDIWQQTQTNYPIQARLYANNGQPELNLGSDLGVKPGMKFQVFPEMGSFPSPGVEVTVTDALLPSIARVNVTGVEADTIPTTPDAAWFVAIQGS